jgi:hypothetical protein
MNVPLWTSSKGMPQHSLQNPDYIHAFQTMLKNCGNRIWETTRRDFIVAADRDGLSFWNGSRLILSMKNLYRTLAKQNYTIINYPVKTPLPHHAGTELGAAKGFSGLPEKWLRKISNQLADKEAGLRFQEVTETDGKFYVSGQQSCLTSSC